MTRVLLVAATTGYQIRSFGAAAGALGVRLILASDRCDQLDDPWWDGAIPVRFADPVRSVDAVLTACAGAAPAAVIAVGDAPAVLAAHVRAALGLPGNPPEAAAASANKLETRQALARAGLPVPRFDVFPASAPPRGAITYPAVVKPLALSGSQGVVRVDDDAALERAFVRLGRLLESPDVATHAEGTRDRLLVETFVPGAEYAVEGLLTQGTFRALAIFDKPDPLDGPYFEETIYLTPSRAVPSIQGAIVGGVAAATRALGLTDGPVHAECRVNPRGVFVLEVAARPIGGLCAKALRFEDGGGAETTLEELLLRHALGQDVRRYRRTPGASGVMMMPIPRRGVYRRVSGVDRAEAVPGIDEVRVTAKPGTLLVPPPEGRSYLGFIFARRDTPDAVEGALRAAFGALTFTIDREIPMGA